MIKKYSDFVNEEVGIKNLSKIVKDKKFCEIYFHKDLDGITSAIAMKQFLKTYYGIELDDCHTIQYGGLEYAIKTHKPGNLPVLVDFAHSKPMFTIATDHHDKQSGAEDTESTYFKSARSNVETISGEIAYSDMFTQTDIDLIKTVDSADFLRNKITPEDVQNSIFRYEKAASAEKNRYMMGFVVNRLLLAYKNKRISVKSLDGKRDHINRNILECLVMDSTPSLHSIFNNIRHYINNATTSDRAGSLASPEQIAANLRAYTDRMSGYRFIEDPETGEVSEYDPTSKKHQFLATKGARIAKGVHLDEEYGIISQYGGGSMFQPGSYDRYVPFKNNPNADFLCIVWPMGLIQVSCNPFKEKALKEINLGEISKEVLSAHQQRLSDFYVSLESLKREFETSQDWKQMSKAEGPSYKGVGFKFSDLSAFYADCVSKKTKEGRGAADIQASPELRVAMDKNYEELSDAEKAMLRSYEIPVWEAIIRNSGGHPSITNISGISFMKYNGDALRSKYGTEKYVDVLRTIAREFINNLKAKIDTARAGSKPEYTAREIELLGGDTNENYEYHLQDDNSGETRQVSREDFVKAGANKAMSPEKIEIDEKNKRIIAKFDNFGK